MSKLCNRHRRHWRKLGHPEATKLFPREYVKERRDVAALFKANAEHAGLLSALTFLDGWLQASTRGDKSQPGYAHMERLQRKGVTALAILSEVSAVWLHIERWRKPDDERLDFALVDAMLTLAPRDYLCSYHYRSGERRSYREASHTDRERIGNHLRTRLAPLFVRVVQACEERERMAKEQAAAERAEFVIPKPRRRRNSEQQQQ